MKRTNKSRKANAKWPKAASSTRPLKLNRYWLIALVGFVIVFSAAIRLRLLQLPLERDEGEYAYAGQLILNGVPPYVQAYNMKVPGTYAAYALLMAIFGQTTSGIHLGLVVVTSGSIVLVFFLTKRLFDSLAGVVAATSLAVLSVSPSVLGLAAHATHFVVLPALAGLLLLLKGSDNKKIVALLLSGVLFGIAFVMKQPGIFFGLFGVSYLLWTEVRERPFIWTESLIRLVSLSFGLALPFGVICIILLAAHAFGKFWFWTFSYASQYVSEIPLKEAFTYFWQSFQAVAGPVSWLWLLAGIGIILLWHERLWRKQSVFVSSLFIFSFFAVCPGFHFRGHYFILLLPAISILIGVAVISIRDLLERRRFSPTVRLWVPILILLIVIGHSLFQQRQLLFDLSAAAACRKMYGSNPFPESIQIANYIRTNTSPTDRIAVIGSEPQIYFYADRRSATGYIYTYGLMEPQKYASTMQHEMIGEIESARPKYIVFVNTAMSWLRGPDSEGAIFDWYAQYRQRYDLVGVVDIFPNQTVYRWGDEVRNYVPHSNSYLYVYKLKSTA